MDITHVVWDWNGTVFDDATLVMAATSHSLVQCGHGPLEPERYRASFRRPIYAFYEAVLGRPLGSGEFEEFDQAFTDYYQAGLPSCSLFNDAHSVFDAVMGYGWSQSLCSMLPHAELVPLVEILGVTGRFVRVDGLRGKRDGRKEEHLREHLEAIGIDASRTVLVGDSVDDAEAALACGAQSVLVTTGLQAPDDLIRVGVPVVDSLQAALDVIATRSA